MKILNLYAGIGGNRKLWGNEHEITAVEYKQEIADIYHDFFPNDKMIVADAHEYLLKHFKEYNFIWSSPPCPSHSDMRRMGVSIGQVEPVYPDMKLYEEIILLQHFCKVKFCVENVIGYYKPLIPPQNINKHYFWANFYIHPLPIESRNHRKDVKYLQESKQFNLDKYPNSVNKRLLLRNCVEPATGLFIFQEAFRNYKTLF